MPEPRPIDPPATTPDPLRNSGVDAVPSGVDQPGVDALDRALQGVFAEVLSAPAPPDLAALGDELAGRIASAAAVSADDLPGAH